MKSSNPLIWVLNLRRSQARRAFMERQLRGFGIEFEIVPAIDGRDLGEHHISLYSDQAAIQAVGRSLAAGEIACALSHASLWQRLLDEKIDEALILEDDIRLGDGFLEIVAARGQFPDDWELINFRTDAGRKPFREFIHGGHRLCRFECHANGACAYLLNQRGARKLLETLYPIRFASDGLTGRIDVTGLISYGIDPQVIQLTDFPSDVWSSPMTPRQLINSEDLAHLNND